MCFGLSRHAFEALLFGLQSHESRARVRTHALNSPDVVVCYLLLLIFLVEVLAVLSLGKLNLTMAMNARRCCVSSS